MQAPAKLDLVCYQGASFDYQLTWNLNDEPVDLTNYDARMQVRPSHGAHTVVLNLTAGTGITLGGTAGTIFIEASPEQTAAIPATQYVYDLEMVAAGGAVTRLVEGRFTVDPEVTR
jgi:hypothetical protein